MALYDLVTLKRALLQNVNPDSVIFELLKLQTQLENIKLQVPVMSIEDSEYIDNLVTLYGQLIKQAVAPLDRLPAHIANINGKINSITHQLFNGNYDLEIRDGGIENVRNHRRIHINSDIEQDVKQRILLHTNWRYPSLEIGCRDGEWTQYLIAADPLYVMDKYTDFLESTKSKFPESYQRRLRTYQLINHNLLELPQNQMAFVFSWGYFNYVSIDTMKQYLIHVLNLLRPGGIFMFSYNDGDTPQGAGMAENFAQTYMPKSMLLPMCESLGYEIHKESNYSNNISWVEVKKPGVLHTVKAHQVMGKIESI